MEKEKAYIVTGADGHVGTTVVEDLEKKDVYVHALIIPSHPLKENKGKVMYFHGDIRDKKTLRPLFEGFADKDIYILHIASLIDISANKITEALYGVNVLGTQNICDLAKEYKVKRVVYVSSVDAFVALGKPTNENSALVEDPKAFGYPITKAMATKEIRARVQDEDLDAVIVYPSAIVGPNDLGSNHMIDTIDKFSRGKLGAIVPGGYDIVDVRDVANGILLAADKGRKGEGYILSGNKKTFTELFNAINEITGQKHKFVMLPMWLAKMGAPFYQMHCRLHHQRCLFTKFAISVVEHANSFSNQKAKDELGFTNLPFEQTIKDTLDYLKANRK
ncbi:MAG: NAD-dependent epimerase/dehydratase family protein [Bacilli bacterium]|jgi:dihydroflavonol-4-reductase|nr:NAD-dependent epimerase/dehydratase family protein [Bacilli bacterium]